MDPLTPYSKHLRAGIDQVVQDGNANGLVDTLQGGFDAITYRYMYAGAPEGQLESALRDQWYILIQAAKNISTQCHQKDTIIRYLVATTSLGPLQRPERTSEDEDGHSTGELQEPIIFADGYSLWSGLPLFSQSLVDEFTKSYYKKSYSAEQRENMGGFLGRLLSVGIYDGPALCVLSLFRETLEVSRPLVANAADNKAAEIPLPLEDLMQALGKVIQHAHWSLAALAIQELSGADTDVVHMTYHPHLSDLGDLALQAGVATTTSRSGFSPQRWMFWCRRFEELSRCGVESIKVIAEINLAFLKHTQKRTLLHYYISKEREEEELATI